MESKFEVSKLNLHYSQFHALKDVSLSILPHEVTALIGPSGCGKSTFLKTLNRMNDLEEGVRIDGKVLLDGKDIFKDMDAISLRQRVGMVFQQPNPFPKSIYENVAYGPKLQGIHSKVKLDEIVEKALRGAAIWDEVKDRLKKKCDGTFWRTAAKTLYRKGACGRTGCTFDGRADQCARSDFDF